MNANIHQCNECKQQVQNVLFNPPLKEGAREEIFLPMLHMGTEALRGKRLGTSTQGSRQSAETNEALGALAL